MLTNSLDAPRADGERVQTSAMSALVEIIRLLEAENGAGWKCKRRFEDLLPTLRATPPRLKIDDLVVGDAPTMPPLEYHVDCLLNIDWEQPAPTMDKVGYHLKMLGYLLDPSNLDLMPLVSVVIPVHNGGDTIRRAVESVLSQDYPRLEMIVVDDGSTDDTAARVSRIRGRIRLIRQENSGVSAARNRGLDHARGTLVHFLDADDELLPGAIAQKVGALALHPEARLCYSHFEVVGEPPSAVGAGFEQFPLDGDRSATGDAMLAACSRFPFQASTILAARWFLDHAGRFETDLRQSEDARYWFHMACNGLRAVAIATPRTRRYRREGSLTHQLAQARRYAIEADLRSARELISTPRLYRYLVCLLTRATWLLDRSFDDGLDHSEIDRLHDEIQDVESRLGQGIPGSEGLTALAIDQLLFMLQKKRRDTADSMRPMLRLWEEREDRLRDRLQAARPITGSDLRRWLPDIPRRPFSQLTRGERASLKFALEQLQVSVLHGELPLRLRVLERTSADYAGHPYERYWRQAARLSRLVGDEMARSLFRQGLFRGGGGAAGHIRGAIRPNAAA